MGFYLNSQFSHYNYISFMSWISAKLSDSRVLTKLSINGKVEVNSYVSNFRLISRSVVSKVTSVVLKIR